jgi:rhodanese-related sulfurtransferase
MPAQVAVPSPVARASRPGSERSGAFGLLLGLLLPLLVSAEETKTIPPAPTPKPAAVREISVNEAEQIIRDRSDVVVIDVRTAPEYAEQGHLPRACLVDYLRDDFAAAIESLKLDPAKPCLVYCAIGARAQHAAEVMVKLGFKEILLPKGSFKAWKKAGKPIEDAAKK